MSEAITVGTGTETIHGTFAGSIAYVAIMYGATYDAWTALVANDQKKTLASAVRLLNAQQWVAAYDTFAEREALPVFTQAQNELAVAILKDPSIATKIDAGNNLRTAYAGGAGVEYFNPTSVAAGTAGKLPPIVQRLIGQYLATGTLESAGLGTSGSCENEFTDDYDRNEPF